MRQLVRAVLATLLVIAITPGAFAKSERRPERVAFHDGRAVIKGRIKGYEYVDHVFRVGAGDSLSVSLKSGPLSNYFNVMAPGETEKAFFIGSTSGDSYSGAAPVSGDYTARVYLMRNDARRGKVANYVLTIVLGEKRQTKEKGPDYADGLTGGPDLWEVSGVAAGDALNIRKEPSAGGAPVARVGNGVILRNLGCMNTRGQRWCRVERANDPSVGGWVNGRYLRESAGPR